MLNLGTLSASAMAAYDRDGDGADDIVLADAAHSVLHVFLRRGNEFVPATAPLLVGSAAPDGGLSAVVGADLDGDGDGDLMAWSDGSAVTHTFLDGLVCDRRPVTASGDLVHAVLGVTAAIPVAVTLPSGLPALASPGTSFCLRMDGWLVDPVTDVLVPQRVLGQDTPIASTQASLETTVTFPLNGMGSNFLLQLQIAVVAVHADGSRHSCPSLLLHLTPSAPRDEAMRAQVELERTGNQATTKSDGGGDGNILGTKTTKIAVGSPPF
jgi:hypothetical protein